MLEVVNDNKIIELKDNEPPLIHNFSEKSYVREIFMEKGQFIIGHKHKTTHLNIVQTGRAYLWIDGVVSTIQAPFTFESKAGCRKALYILEDMFWSTVHVNEDDERDLDKLKDRFVDVSASENAEQIYEEIKLKSIEDDIFKGELL